LKITIKIVNCHTADFKPVKQEVNSTVILPPLVFPDVCICTHVCMCVGVSMHVCECPFMYACVCVHACMHVSVCPFMCACVCVHSCMHVCVCPCMYVCVHVCIKCIYLWRVFQLHIPRNEEYKKHKIRLETNIKYQKCETTFFHNDSKVEAFHNQTFLQM
jgi:hypothetical protein